jgi:hypothetical protein
MNVTLPFSCSAMMYRPHHLDPYDSAAELSVVLGWGWMVGCWDEIEYGEAKQDSGQLAGLMEIVALSQVTAMVDGVSALSERRTGDTQFPG